jgi:hypothetical protein
MKFSAQRLVRILILSFILFGYAESVLAQSDSASTTPEEAPAPHPRPKLEETEPFLVTQPPDVVPAALNLDLSDLEWAQNRVGTSRLWLLVTSGSFALGWVMVFAGSSQCETINGVFVCPQAADKTTTAGALFLAFGSIGVLTSSIMLGVRNGKKRELERLTAQYLGVPIEWTGPFYEYALADARDRSLRARNALIGSAASFALGWVFLPFAFPRCERLSSGIECTTAGYVHMTLGLGFAAAGSAGMIVSGILLGVRNANRRWLHRAGQRREGARLRWDPQSGAFVF